MLMIANRKQGTIVHFLANPGGGVWSVAKTLAVCHRPRWRVVLAAIDKGQVRPSLAAEVEEHFDAAYLARRPALKGIHYLAPVSVAAAVRALGVDPAADNVVYHFHTGPFTPWMYRLPRKCSPGKWLACFHGSRGNFHDVHNRAKRMLHIAGVRRLLKKRFTLVAVSNRSARDCAEMYRCGQDDFRVVHNGTGPHDGTIGATDTDVNRPFRVGFLGTVMRPKGWHKVVAAVRQLQQDRLNVTCAIVGGGPELDRLQQLAAEHADWLEAPGHVQKPEENVFPKLDVLVLPSDFEGHPEVLLEAMSCGVPCICSDVGGNAETIRPGREGYILRENTAEEIAGCIKRIIDGRGLWKRMSENCVTRHREMFTAEHMAAGWERLYLEGH
jgi:glycosyltransferase involved in cell wall biosynthesis